MWIEPKETSGGQWTGWEEVKRKRYFVIQRHFSADKPIEGLVFGVRSLLSRSPQMPYRIIISVRPYYAVALGANLKEILEHWKWINKNLVRTGRLEAMEEKEVLAFVNYIFSLLSSGKEEKVRQILSGTAEAHATTFTQDCPATAAAVNSESTLSPPSVSNPAIGSSTTTSLPTTDDDDEKDLCKLCFENLIETVILDCGHALLCSRCAQTLKAEVCPICRSPIRTVQKLYKC